VIRRLKRAAKRRQKRERVQDMWFGAGVFYLDRQTVTGEWVSQPIAYGSMHSRRFRDGTCRVRAKLA
jgi:hypothetical protein